MSFRTVTAALAALGLIFSAVASAQSPPRVEFREGDRVVLLGGTFIERLQTHGNLELLLTTGQPDKNVTFRNLGWSGDNVFGLARAVFGSQADGFARLKKDVFEVKPTVILIAYGANEANAGQEGLASFTAGLNTLLDTLKESGARLVLLSPTKRENLGPPLPNPAEFNETLRLYADVLRETANKRNLPFVDLSSIIGGESQSADPRPVPIDQVTDNGIHLSAYGDWRVAPKLAEKLGVSAPEWRLELDLSNKSYDAVGLSVLDLAARPDVLKFTAKDDQLPLASPPGDAPKGAEQVAPPRLLRIRGLPRGLYEVRIDGKVVAKAEPAQLGAGVQLARGPEFEQSSQLRQVIEEKNLLYFHRHRPQNETYLFLFRKHEQGNNAVEIPQFDPLIAEKEKLIAELRKPKSHVYEVVPAR